MGMQSMLIQSINYCNYFDLVYVGKLVSWEQLHNYERNL